MGVNHTENWQKVKREYSETLRDKRDATTKEDARATRLIEQQVKTAAKLSQTSENAAALAKPDVKQPVSPGRDVPQMAQKARSESQDHATRQEARTAQSEFARDKQRAGELRQLEGRANLRSNERFVTREAVAAKSPPAELEISKRPANQPQTAAGAVDIAAREAARQNAARHVAHARRAEQNARARQHGDVPAADAQQTATSKGMRPAPENPSQRTAQVPQMLPVNPELKRSETSSECIKDKKVERRSNGANSQHRPQVASPSREGGSSSELGGLLGGGVGGEAMPELDANFQVYNEFSSDAPGPEYMKSKWQLFQNRVEKRLAEIVKLDREVSFKIESLSKRIEGGFSEDIRLADFIRNVYGGTSA